MCMQQCQVTNVILCLAHLHTAGARGSLVACKIARHSACCLDPQQPPTHVEARALTFEQKHTLRTEQRAAVRSLPELHAVSELDHLLSNALLQSLERLSAIHAVKTFLHMEHGDAMNCETFLSIL